MSHTSGNNECNPQQPTRERYFVAGYPEVGNPSNARRLKRCAIYARTATRSSSGLSEQIASCRAAADRHGWLVVDELIATDDGLSSLHWAARPGLDRLLEALESQQRPFDCLLVRDVSRLSRNMSLLLRIANVFSFYGVAICSAQTDSIVELDELLFGMPTTGGAGTVETQVSTRLPRRFLVSYWIRFVMNWPIGTLLRPCRG
jgi:hypothetical protein